MTRAADRVRLSLVADRLLWGVISTLSALAGRLPLVRVLALGKSVGRGWARLGLPRTRRVRDQLEQAYPDHSSTRLDGWTRDVFEHLGQGLAELIAMRSRHRAALVESVEIEGLEHLEAAERVSPSGGVLIVSAHYGNWELGGVRLAEIGIAVSAIFRGVNRSALDRAMSEVRSDRAAPGVGRSDPTATDSPGRTAPTFDYEQIQIGRAGVGLLRALRSGRKALVLLDQASRPNDAVSVPFFGRPASVRTGPIRIALRAGVPIVTAFTRRHPTGGGHRLRFDPPFAPGLGVGLAVDRHGIASEASNPALRSGPEGEDLVEGLAAELTKRIEAAIREEPTQWIWTHRRWRHRSDQAPR